MRIVVAIRSLALVAAGCLLVWAAVVWRWHDPITALHTFREQRSLAASYDRIARAWDQARPPGPHANLDELRAVARRYRSTLERGEPVGRLAIPRLDLDLIVANGADSGTLRKGPGRDFRSFVPGEGELVYLAGHRTTYLAPFGDIDKLRPGDRITLEVPYGTFVYAVARATVVGPTDLSVLRSPGRETLALQTCHPRFFASERYVVFAELVGAT